MPDKIIAVGLLSGGLDSTLAAKVVMEQGIEVHAINFVSPFCLCTPKGAGCPSVVQAVRQLGDIPLRRVSLGQEYLDMVLSPKHGRGRGMNPCLDCRIMKLKKAAEFMASIGGSFLFTGEVLGQRPMSQHRQALRIIDRDSGLGDIIVRPLSAQHLEPTKPERDELIDRKKLLSISGRSRKVQMSLAAGFGISDYPCPAGGCLLTDINFCRRLREHVARQGTMTLTDISLLKLGRHYWTDKGNKVIVARNKLECERLATMTGSGGQVLQPDNFAGPTVWFAGDDLPSAAARLVDHTKHLPVNGARLRLITAATSTEVLVEMALQV